jgi:hypothetical protein
MSRMEWLAYIGPGVGFGDPWDSVGRVAILVPICALALGMLALAGGHVLALVGRWLFDQEPPAALRLGPQRPWPPGAR